MPNPRPSEAKTDFIPRCMGDAEAVRDFPDAAQRRAVCESLWDQAQMEQFQCPPGKRHVEGKGCLEDSEIDALVAAGEIEEFRHVPGHPEDDPMPEVRNYSNYGRIVQDVGGSRLLSRDDSFSIVKFAKGVDLLKDPITDEILAIGFCRDRFPGAAVIERWMTESPLPLEKRDTGRVALQAGRKLFAPKVEFGFYPAEVDLTRYSFTAEELLVLQQHRGLVMKALPITPGTHKGFVFSEQVIVNARPLFLNAPVVEHHTFNVPSDVKGRILEVMESMGRLVATALIMDPNSAALIRSGHFHSVSSHIVLEADSNMVVEVINEVVELTLTDDPADPNAVVLSHEDIGILIASHSQPPETEASSQQQIGGISLENNDQANEPTSGTSTGPAPAPVAMEAPVATPPVNTTPAAAPVAPAPAPVAVANSNGDDPRIAQLETQVTEARQAIEFMAATQKAKDALTLARGLVDAGKITPAQMEPAGKLLASLGSEDQVKLFEQFVGHNQVAPLGGAEAANAGMVSGQTAGNFSLEKAVQGMTDMELEFLKYVDLNQEYEARNGFGPEIAARHQKNGFFGGVFPTLQHGNQPDRRGYEQ